ncbi:MAG TPA: HAD family hydrolase [Candidatus Acidoferrum sp.]|jgi:HAD superfamily hydrolase (TIGR01549 family)|nr:HAD family hydrolase [Candidatus Acidoferrum sp.]
MADRRVIFFDVGNTLLFPNRPKMLAPIPSDRHPSLQQWQELERRTKQEFDQRMQGGRVDHGFWWIFHTHLLEGLGEDTTVRKELVENTQNSANWDQILPGTRDVLERISRKFRIAVISNADGGIECVLSRCGIADCFESITDSGIVGVEKPRAEIFEAALNQMKTRADECVYVGDVYSVDYLGARNVGMQAVLFDLAGAYRDRDLPRVESLEQLEARLQQSGSRNSVLS